MRQEDYPPGTIVFAKLKGYPWWPARVEDDKNVPPHVLSARSTKSKNPVWTVFFFGSKDYGFFGPDAIKPFHPDNVERDLNDKKFKTKDLENAIRQALYPSLLEDEENEEEEEEEHEQEEKKSQRTKTKSKTKKAVKGGKRASKMEEDEKEKIFTATERGARKKKSTLTSSDASSRRKRLKTLPMKSEDNNNNNTNSVSGCNDDHSSAAEGDKMNMVTNASEEYQEYRSRIYKLRHKLQRLVYNKKPGEIPKEDYRTISAVLKSVEDAHMTAQLLRDTKVGSVVKSASRYVYEDDEFNLQHRCRLLIDRWREQFTPHRRCRGDENNIGPSASLTSDALKLQSETKENDTVRSLVNPTSTTDKTKDLPIPIGQIPPVATTSTTT